MYTNESHIKTVKDVEAFFHYLVEERRTNFDPHDDMRDTVVIPTSKQAFTDEEATLFNRLLKECFEVCDKTGTDIDWLSFQELKKVIDNTLD